MFDSCNEAADLTVERLTRSWRAFKRPSPSHHFNMIRLKRLSEFRPSHTQSKQTSLVEYKELPLYDRINAGRQRDGGGGG